MGRGVTQEKGGEEINITFPPESGEVPLGA